MVKRRNTMMKRKMRTMVEMQELQKILMMKKRKMRSQRFFHL